MFFKTPNEPAPRRPGSRTQESESGIVGRVKAASGHGAPPPAGKQLVMLLMGVVVAGALIMQFARGAPGRATPDKSDEAGPVVAPLGPPAADSTTPPLVRGPQGAAPPLVRGPQGAAQTAQPFRFRMDAGAALPIQVDIEGAASLIASAPHAERAGLRLAALKGLLAAGQQGAQGPALQGAAWLLEGAQDVELSVLGALGELALRALDQDTSAWAAMLLLQQLPDQGGLLAMAALDRLILGTERPLSLRIQAATLRPLQGRPADVQSLLGNESVHPALRKALAR